MNTITVRAKIIGGTYFVKLINRESDTYINDIPVWRDYILECFDITRSTFGKEHCVIESFIVAEDVALNMFKKMVKKYEQLFDGKGDLNNGITAS